MQLLSKIVSFFLFPILVLLTHLVASGILDLYTLFPNIDIPFHYMGGLSIAYAATQVLAYLQKSNRAAGLNRILFLTLVFSLTATATVFWEFAEFSVDSLLAVNVQVSLANTMQDQFMGILGGATGALLFYLRPTLFLR